MHTVALLSSDISVELFVLVRLFVASIGCRVKCCTHFVFYQRSFRYSYIKKWQSFGNLLQTHTHTHTHTHTQNSYLFKITCQVTSVIICECLIHLCFLHDLPTYFFLRKLLRACQMWGYLCLGSQSVWSVRFYKRFGGTFSLRLQGVRWGCVLNSDTPSALSDVSASASIFLVITQLHVDRVDFCNQKSFSTPWLSFLFFLMPF